MRIGINGFGRIGRNFTKALLERYPQIAIAAVNDLTSAAELAHLFKHDSNYGNYDGEVGADGDQLKVGSQKIKVVAERDPGKIPWKDPRRRRRDRIDRPVHERRESRLAHQRRRRKKSHHLSACKR